LVVNYELENLEGFVGEVETLISADTLTENKFNQIKNSILQEKVRVQNAFKRKFLAGVREDRTRRFFEYHQMSLTRLLDEFYLKAVSDQKESLDDLIGFVYSCLEDLLMFIQRQFPKYFTSSHKAPDHYVVRVLKVVEVNKNRLLQRFEANGVHDTLKTLVASAFLVDKESISFNRLKFLGMLQSEFKDYSGFNTEWIKQYFLETLVKLNYNSPAFLLYYCDHINSSLTSCETLADRIDQLSYFIKIVNQVQQVSNVVYDDTLPSIKTQLLDWIAHELEYYRQKQMWNLSTTTSEPFIKNDFKLIFDLSVANLAYLFNILLENNILLNKNTSEVIRFLTKFVKTKKAESISYESFRIKFYNTESGTKDAVKKTLQSLLSYINKH
jgi:hypothetical protein